jgi:hypothetical protein
MTTGLTPEEREALLMPTIEINRDVMKLGDYAKMQAMCAGLVKAGIEYRNAVQEWRHNPTKENKWAMLRAEDNHDVALVKAKG